MNGIGTRYEMRREALLAAITIIPKEGKDTTLGPFHTGMDPSAAPVDLS